MQVSCLGQIIATFLSFAYAIISRSRHTWSFKRSHQACGLADSLKIPACPSEALGMSPKVMVILNFHDRKQAQNNMNCSKEVQSGTSGTFLQPQLLLCELDFSHRLKRLCMCLIISMKQQPLTTFSVRSFLSFE